MEIVYLQFYHMLCFKGEIMYLCIYFYPFFVSAICYFWGVVLKIIIIMNKIVNVIY